MLGRACGNRDSPVVLGKCTLEDNVTAAIKILNAHNLDLVIALLGMYHTNKNTIYKMTYKQGHSLQH